MATGDAAAQDAGLLTTDDRGSTVFTSDRYSWQTGQSPTDRVKSSANYSWRAATWVQYSVAGVASSPTQADIREIAGYYTAAFPSLQLVEASPAYATFVTTRPPQCDPFPGLPPPLGCYFGTNFTHLENAYWPLNGTIYIDSNQSQAVRRNVIAHEIGHLYGLDEVYLEDSAYTDFVFCNSAEPASVMDAIGCDGYPDSPTPYDRQRLTAYWTAQPPTVISATSSGGSMVHLWKSNGYTEREGVYNGKYWNGSSFVSYTGDQPLDASLGQISFKWMDWRTALNTFTTGLPPFSPHRMCIKTYSAGINGWSSEACREYPATRLVGFWQFEEGTGNAANDSSGYGNHGTLYNSPTWVSPGKVGSYALSFDGVNDYVGIPSSSSTLPFLTTSPWTIAMWVKYEGNNSYYPQFSKGGTTYGFTIHGSNGRIQGGDGANPLHTFDEYNMFQGGLVGQGWKHTVVTYDGVTFKAYVDGVLKRTLAWGWGSGAAEMPSCWGPSGAPTTRGSWTRSASTTTPWTLPRSKTSTIPAASDALPEGPGRPL